MSNRLEEILSSFQFKIAKFLPKIATFIKKNYYFLLVCSTVFQNILC